MTEGLINPSKLRSVTSVSIKTSDYLGLKVRPVLNTKQTLKHKLGLDWNKGSINLNKI